MGISQKNNIFKTHNILLKMFKHSLLFIMLLFAAKQAHGQQYDMVVTQTDDSIVCKIQKVSTFTVTYETLINGDWETVECGADCLTGVYYKVARKNQYKYEPGTLRVIGRKRSSDNDDKDDDVVSETETTIVKNNHYVNIGAGIGQTFGGIGEKSIIGINNSGFVLGLGLNTPHSLGYNIGLQYAFDVAYLNLNYGTVYAEEDKNDNVTKVESFSLLAGGMFGLGYKKAFYIDLGFGISSGFQQFHVSNYDKELMKLCLHLGLMYRIGR